MSKSRRKIDSRQSSIFDLLQRLSEPEPTTEGQLKVVDRLRGTIRSAIKNCPLSRHQIAGEMSHLAGQTITKEMIDSWTRESDEINGRPGRHIPAEYLPALCVVTESIEPLRVLGEKAGAFVFRGPEAMRAEIQRYDEKIKELQAEKKKRMIFLKEMER